MHVALTGASGFIGAAVARHLARAGHTVTALVRATSRRDHVAPHVAAFVEGDHADESVWPRLLDGADALVHNSVAWPPLREPDPRAHLASNLVASLRLLDAAAPRRLVFMSTIAVHHDMRPRWQGRIDEDHPMRPASRYGAYKAAVETHLWALHHERGVPFCALRPCAVYGIDPRLDRSIGHPIVERLRRERRYAKAGGGKFVHVDDVAAATAAAVAGVDDEVRVCNLADCYARWSDLAAMIADELGIDAEIDHSSPPRSRNEFTKDAARRLGVALDRGHDGLRAHVRELIEVMGERD